MDNGSESVTMETSFKPRQVCYMHLHTNTLGNVINSPLLSPTMSFNVMIYQKKKKTYYLQSIVYSLKNNFLGLNNR